MRREDMPVPAQHMRMRPARDRSSPLGREQKAELTHSIRARLARCPPARTRGEELEDLSLLVDPPIFCR